MQSHITRVQIALEELRLGKPIILTDDVNRENEGDLIFPAAKITPEIMNFIIRHSSGVVCLALTESHLQKLHLPLMLPTADNTSRCQSLAGFACRWAQILYCGTHSAKFTD